MIKKRLEKMSPNGHGAYNLWKATKSLPQPQQCSPPIRSGSTWARTDQEKSEAFAIHLSSVFKPNDADTPEDPEIEAILKQDLQMCLPLRHTTPKELTKIISKMNPNKSPGFDLITPRLLKELPRKCLVFLTILFNATFRTSHVPTLWKTSQIVMIHKPGKPPNEASSYRPISLTPVLSKLWERIVLERLSPCLEINYVIPDHQYGFRKHHSTIEQVHRVYSTIRQCLEQKEYCSAAFLDVQQAFDRVWHKGLLCKIKKILPHPITS
ncbi:Probable RNA-directed DNA polymerase from transposon X-element [Eumeta japonica]|uniref:Probable RNA-directed DNA polymerase from transposon X-element n=1 Tax=Eumeta variegata TaxID=151549 RepID=A0A4C1YTV0_EUMVA|nr:Probable RNA-directed DNA polymerase from transposon X-element [Eumeta japonica]